LLSLLTPWNRGLLKRLIVAELSNKMLICLWNMQIHCPVRMVSIQIQTQYEKQDVVYIFNALHTCDNRGFAYCQNSYFGLAGYDTL
jgi:hypothetical protein